MSASVNIKYFLWLVLVLSLVACKSSPSADYGADSEVTTLSETAKAVATENNTNDSLTPAQESTEPKSVEVESVIISTAEMDSSSVPRVSDYSVSSGEFNLLPRESTGWDENGWSVLTPSDDSRIIYVSSSEGDDNTGEFYAPRDIDNIQDPGLIMPFKTIHAAIEQSRKGFPDWILLRRGDEWEVGFRAELKAGRSVDERAVLTSYGKSLTRPVISKSDGREMLRIWSNRNYVVVKGISFHALERDPDSSSFLGWGNVSDLDGILIYGPEGTKMGSILLEDNHFNYLSKGISIVGDAKHVDIVIRRNIIRNSYSENGHAQGMGASSASVLLEENVFDHNGWLVQQVIEGGDDKTEGQATIYNHNTYFMRSVDTIFRNNIFLRPSSIHNKWTANPEVDGVDGIVSRNLVMENNLYVGGEIGISAGGNEDYDNGHRWANISILDNVMLAIGRNRPTNRNLGWYIDAIDWDGGTICGNYLLKNDDPLVQNINGIKLNGHSKDVDVSKNIIYDLFMTDSSNNNGAIRMNSDPKSNIRIFDNNVQLAGSMMRPVISDNIASTDFDNNVYFSGADDDQWFRVDGDNNSFDSWQVISGDIGSSVEQRDFSQPERSFETYLSSIGMSSNIDDFIDAVRGQPENTWDERFSAVKINSYIREGYGNTTCN